MVLLSLFSLMFSLSRGGGGGRSRVTVLADSFTFIVNLVSTTGNGTPNSYLQVNDFSSVVKHICPTSYCIC